MPTGSMRSSGWKLAPTMALMFHRKKFAYLKYPRMPSEAVSEHATQSLRAVTDFSLTSSRDSSQSNSEVANSSTTKTPLDL